MSNIDQSVLVANAYAGYITAPVGD